MIPLLVLTSNFSVTYDLPLLWNWILSGFDFWPFEEHVTSLPENHSVSLRVSVLVLVYGGPFTPPSVMCALESRSWPPTVHNIFASSTALWLSPVTVQLITAFLLTKSVFTGGRLSFRERWHPWAWSVWKRKSYNHILVTQIRKCEVK